MAAHHAKWIKEVQDFFNRSTRIFDEADANFAPVPGMFNVAAQVMHTALTVEWFAEGAFRPEGFSMDFEEHDRLARGVASLADARARLDSAFAHAAEVFGSKTDAELMEPLPPGMVMGGEPRIAVLSGIEDHTAHHRGALTVYARLLGKTPPMPYMEM
ncbi:MAG: DinB family protein [Candidatus Sumerlaeia bacterium]|nr:DinB family protein [Candidatus Sumerlaeia bacterium]